MNLWLNDIWDMRSYIGEKKLRDNILDNVKREIDLIIFIVNNLLEYKGNEIDGVEFMDRFRNIRSNSTIKSNKIYDITKMKKLIDGDVKVFIDLIFDFDNIINEFDDFNLNNKDKDKLKKYYLDKVKYFMSNWK